MSRLSLALRLAVLLVLAAALLGLPARAEDEAEAESKPEDKPSLDFATDLDAKTQKSLAGVVSAYLDPEVEFLWRPRKNFIAALDAIQADKGVNPLVDIPFLRQAVYQGRHFRPRFSDKKWQRDREITEFKKENPYLNLVSEGYRFSYAVPKGYPKDRALAKPPRPAAYPLLLCIHEERDTKDSKRQSEKFPGGAVLKRRFPKDDFEELYEQWLMLAPVAARARFLEDGAIRHRYLTGVLSDFWRRYHVDFDRIIVDGAAPAAAMAAAFPHVFAGVVLRPGKDMTLETEVVRNFATVPVFVVDDKDLGKQLEEAGHGQVTVGSAKEVATWMGEQRRQMPKSFRWSLLRPDHEYANWMVITGPDYAAPDRTLEVDAVDTADDPNTIKITAKGMEKLRLFLNDEIVDLDRDIRIVVNGEEKVLAKTDRDFGRLFEKDPEVRRNMNFGWLFTMLIEDLRVPEPVAEEPAGEPTEPTPEAGPTGSPEDEAKAEKFWKKAEEALAAGEPSRAKLYLNKIVELGDTSFKAKAEAKLDEL